MQKCTPPSIEIGQRFHKITILSEMVRRKIKSCPRSMHLCQCDCGSAPFYAHAYSLKSGRARSCGCEGIARRTKHGDASDNKQKHPLYKVWSSMRARCKKVDNKWTHNHGARGISVCKEWDNYPLFKEWALSHGYEHGLQIDRTDNDGDYSPENCRFVTQSQNLLNTRQNHRETAFGETKTLTEWTRDSRCLVSFNTLRTRIASGWTVENALTKPIRVTARWPAKP